MGISSNKWIKKPTDHDKIIRARLRVFLKKNKLSWAELGRQHDCDKGSLQRSIESKLGSVKDFLNKYGYEIEIKKIVSK